MSRSSSAYDIVDELFRWVLDTALSNGGYVVATVEAYFDESGTHEGAVAMCMAGYTFEKTRSEILQSSSGKRC